MDSLTFIGDLDAGVFANKIAAAIKKAATGAIAHHKQGQVVIALNFKQVGEGNNVLVSHKLSFVQPTAKGKAGEEETTETAMHLNKDGSVTIFPATQTDFFKTETA